MVNSIFYLRSRSSKINNEGMLDVMEVFNLVCSGSSALA
jgi:hypothetical protein